jgi:two-component system C4-dicarboxylate transport sensor histidine kinase DctB
MSRFRLNRTGLVLGFLSAVLVLTAGVWAYGYRQALGQVAARGEADLALASDRLVTQLERYRETAVLLSDHPLLAALHGGAPREGADLLLLQAVDKTAALTAYYADADGRILAAAHETTASGLTVTTYFRRALQGALGADFGWDAGFERRAYFFAAPTFAPNGAVRGVLVVVVDLDKLEQDWRGSRPAVLFTDASGQVFITNRSELLFWRLDRNGLMAPDGDLHPVNDRYVGQFRLWTQTLSPYVPRVALHLSKPLPVIGMTGEALVDTAPARRLAWLQAAVVGALCLTFGAVLFVVMERRRTLAEANMVLETRVAERTRALQDINTALRREVAERQEAEAALKRVQADLVQAGKLSALGKMSAGISHELNQPLMAIRSFAENGTAFLDRGAPERAADNLRRISDMAHRMGRIIKNLRAFARQESEPAIRVGLAAVVEGAIELLQARATKADVRIDWERPDRPAIVMGGEVRLSQVVVNLLSNAIDAMAGQPMRVATLRIHHNDAEGLISLTVQDTGPGIAEPERIFDPFYSTKETGPDEGMGLGLSISYGIVEGFGGKLRGENRPGGGALFTMDLQQAKVTT